MMKRKQEMATRQQKKSGIFLDPKSDVVFNKIFGEHPDLIKSFLNNLLPLPEGRLIKTIQYLTPEQAPRIPGLLNTIMDVKCTDETGRIFIVAIKMTWSKRLLSRFLLQTSKACVQRLDKGKTYNPSCPVYGLALANETFEETTDGWFHHYRLTNMKDLGKTLEGMEVMFLELPKFNPKTFEDRKVGVLWIRFLRETNALNNIPEGFKEEFKDSPEVIKAVELAQESAYTKAELAAYDEGYLDAVRVQQTVRADALKEGQERGIEKSIQKGTEEERKRSEKKLEEERRKNLKEKKGMARKMLQMGISVKDVHNVTNLPKEVIQSLLV